MHCNFGDNKVGTAVIVRAGRFARRRLRQAHYASRWVVTDFLRNPGLEAYSWYESRKNRRFARDLRMAAAEGRDASLRDHYPRRIPRTIWLFWKQGEAAAPHVVRQCIASWRRHNPGWEVRVLDARAANAQADISDVPAFLPPRCHANMLRLRLLRRHGGVWADATTYCHRPLDEWLPLAASSGFFAFAHPGPGRWVDSWFLAAEPGHLLIAAWEEQYAAYITGCRQKSRKYFMVMYSFQWRVLTRGRVRAAWRRMTKIPGQPAFLLMSALRELIPMPVVQDAVRGGLPMSKLSYKAGLPDTAFDRAFAALEPHAARRRAG